MIKVNQHALIGVSKKKMHYVLLRPTEIVSRNESNRYVLHFIYYQLISISETTTGESAASALER